MQKFLLLAERRSGTTLLIDCLESHPDIVCVKRAFGLDKKIKNPNKNEHSGDYYLFRTEALKNRLIHVFNRKKSISNFLNFYIFRYLRDEPVVGFRFIYNNVKAYPDVLQWCEKNNVKVVHLIRKNVLKTYISTLTAKMHKMHHPRAGDKVSYSKLEIDTTLLIGELTKRVEDISKNRELFSQNPYIEVVYEEFLDNKEFVSSELLTFLGADKTISLESDLLKINPSNLNDVVINYEEVRSILNGSQFEQFLDSQS